MMTTTTLPKCPKCGGESGAPPRAGMSSTPYRCMTCSHNFGLLVLPIDMSRLQSLYNDADAATLLANSNVRYIYTD